MKYGGSGGRSPPENFGTFHHKFCNLNKVNLLTNEKFSLNQGGLLKEGLLRERRYRYENTSKKSQEHIFDNISLVRPLPADPGHESDWQNQENHQKIAKNAIFQKSIFCSIVAGNMIFGRKLVL